MKTLLGTLIALAVSIGVSCLLARMNGMGSVPGIAVLAAALLAVAFVLRRLRPF